MHIVLLSTFECVGGAAVAADRLMQALAKQGVDVKMIVRDQQTKAADVLSVNTSSIAHGINKIRFLWERIAIYVCKRFDRTDLFKLSLANTGSDVSRYSEVRNADIIHIHWVNQGFLSLDGISKLLKLGKPVVWTMHDMWPFTGICHHARSCNHFMYACGNCFFLNSKSKNDLSNRVFQKKKRVLYSCPNLFLVGCSKWLTENARNSSLTDSAKLIAIPNPIDTTLFRPMEKSEARQQLGLPFDKKLILFGAVNLSDKRKGFEYLISAIERLKKENDSFLYSVCLITFGQADTAFIDQVKIPVYSMGYLSDPKKIVQLYNAVDVFITPSLEENLPNMIMEAMSCGIPCIGFHVGGIPEMIDHQKNGYVANYEDSEDLAKGLVWVLNEADYGSLSERAREKVLAEYSEAVVAEQYINLYKNLLSR